MERIQEVVEGTHQSNAVQYPPLPFAKVTANTGKTVLTNRHNASGQVYNTQVSLMPSCVDLGINAFIYQSIFLRLRLLIEVCRQEPERVHWSRLIDLSQWWTKHWDDIAHEVFPCRKSADSLH